MTATKKVRIILNPASGMKNPPLHQFNALFKDAGIEWDMVVTKELGDGIPLAQKAIKDGVDIVATFGGDGTVMDVACGLQNTGIPMAILPGGTGNVLSAELGIPRDLKEAASLITHPRKTRIREIDLGNTGDKNLPAFALRAGVGLEANMLENTDRESKEKYGIFAYIMNGIQALRDIKESAYHLQLDEEDIEVKGLTCLIANAGAFGVPGLTIDPGVKIDDGLLDVFVIRKPDLLGLFSIAAAVVGGSEVKDPVRHWQVKKVTIEADPIQQTQADGEMWGKSPIQVTVAHKSLKVIVPKDK